MKILIIGFGSIGKRHLETSKMLLPEATFAILKSTRNYHSTFSEVDFIFDEIKDALAYNPDIVVLSNPASQHLEYGIEFVQSNANLLIEKPLSDSSSKFKDFSDAVRKQDVTIAVGYNLKFSPSLRFLKQALKEKKIGTIYAVECSVAQYLPDWRPDQDYRNSVSARKELGGGVLLELSHEINYLSWLFGKIKSVVCISQKISDLEIDVEDSANLILQVQPGSHKISISLHMDFLRRDSSRSCTVIGEKGTLIWDYIKGEVRYFDPQKKEWINLYSKPPSKNETYILEWKDFLQAIKHRGNPMTTYTEAFETLKVVEAAKISNGNLVEIEY